VIENSKYSIIKEILSKDAKEYEANLYFRKRGGKTVIFSDPNSVH
jgi:hypothetical protein